LYVDKNNAHQKYETTILFFKYGILLLYFITGVQRLDDTEKEITYIQQIACECIERWGVDSKTKDFSRKLGKFASQLQTDKELGGILLELVKHYNYYSRAEIEKILRNIFNIINDDLKLNRKKTIYSRIEDDSKIDSSNHLLEEYKAINNISNNYSHDIERLHIDIFEEITNVIFIDDIIGSGKTIQRFFNKNLKKLSKVKIYIFCIEILEEGKTFLENYFKEKGLNCLIIPKNIHSQAFKNTKIFSSDILEKEKMLRTFEENLFGKGHPHVMGFENSQAIVSFYRNTPNNTFGSFWYSGHKWQGLFPRDNDKPDFMRKKGKKTKNTMNYNINRPRPEKNG
jgi:hypothetical protein